MSFENSIFVDSETNNYYSERFTCFIGKHHQSPLSNRFLSPELGRGECPVHEASIRLVFAPDGGEVCGCAGWRHKGYGQGSPIRVPDVDLQFV